MKHWKSMEKLWKQMWGLTRQTLADKVDRGTIIYIPFEGRMDITDYIDTYLKKKLKIDALELKKIVDIPSKGYYILSELLEGK